MKKILLALALIITTFAIAKNIDDSNIKSLVGPTAPRNFVIKPLVNQYWNANTFIWDSDLVIGTSNQFFTIYLKRTTESSFRKINVSIIGKEYTLTEEQMPMPMNYALYVTSTVNGIESPPSNYNYYAGGEDISPKIPSLVDENVYNASTEGFAVDCGNSTSPNIVGYFFYANYVPVGFSATSMHTIVGLNPNTSYKISVAVMNQYGNMSAPSAVVTKTTLDYVYPRIKENAPSYDADNYIKQIQIGLNNYKYPLVQRNMPAREFPNNFNNFSGSTLVGAPKLYIGAKGNESNNNILVVRVANKSLRDASVFVGVDFDYNGVFDASEISLIAGMNFQNNNLPNIANIGSNNVLNDIPLDFTSTIVVPETAYAGKVKMRIIYSRYKFPEFTTEYLLVNFKRIQLNDFLGNLSVPNTLPIGEIQDFDVELVRPAATATRNALSKEVVVQELKNNLSEKPNATNFVLYPNPVSGDFMNISLVEDNTPYRIINMLGQEVGGGNVKNGSISVAKLNTGNYFIEINNKDQRIVKRFIKQ